MLHVITHAHTHTVGFIRLRDWTVAEISTWQHTTLTRDRHHCPRRNSSPQSQQASSLRPKLQTARPEESTWLESRDICPRRNSSPQSQQSSSLRPKLQTARRAGSTWLESSDINPLSVLWRRPPAAPDTRPHLITYPNGAGQDAADFQLTKPLNHMLQCSLPCRMGGFPLTRMKVGYYRCLTGSFTCYHQEIMAEGEKG